MLSFFYDRYNGLSKLNRTLKRMHSAASSDMAMSWANLLVGLSWVEHFWIFVVWVGLGEKSVPVIGNEIH
jgi:hypothetical protein